MIKITNIDNSKTVEYSKNKREYNRGNYSKRSARVAREIWMGVVAVAAVITIAMFYITDLPKSTPSVSAPLTKAEKTLFDKYGDRLAANANLKREDCFRVSEHIARVVKKLESENDDIDVDLSTLEISVGRIWAQIYREKYKGKYGEPLKIIHRYPGNDSRIAAVGNYRVFCYAMETLPEFDKFLDNDYIPGRLPVYIKRHIKKNEK
jgi:hypothetical protein